MAAIINLTFHKPFTIGRDEATRTPDPYVPNVVRYQLRYIPLRGFGVKRLQRYGNFLKYVHKTRYFFKKLPAIAWQSLSGTGRTRRNASRSH